LESTSVRHALAVEITDAVIAKRSPDLSSYRTALIPIAENVIETPAFKIIFRDAVSDAHHAVFERHGDVALLNLGESLKLLGQNARASSATVGSALPDTVGSLLVKASPELRHLGLWRYAHDARWIDGVSMVVTLLALAGAFLVSRRRHTLVR